jgi:hypothetical protein
MSYIIKRDTPNSPLLLLDVNLRHYSKKLLDPLLFLDKSTLPLLVKRFRSRGSFKLILITSLIRKLKYFIYLII